MFNKLEEYQNSKLERLVLDGNDLSKLDLGDVTFLHINISWVDYLSRAKLKHLDL